MTAPPVLPLAPRDTADVAALLREAPAHGAPLRMVAGGGWLDAGRPVASQAVPVSLDALRGIVAYVPGDLTLTARASTTLAEIEAATRAHGQWLPLDPVAGPAATVGATLATASFGAMAAEAGHPRDVALGLEVVDGRGVVARAGGRVVKNVAGFDLVRLHTGAWGSLGVITEVTVRLQARPVHEGTVALPCTGDPGALETLLAALRGAPITRIASALLDAARAEALGLGRHDVLLVRLGGNARAVAAQGRLVRALAPEGHDAPAACWEALRVPEPAGTWTLRVSQRPSGLAALWHAVGATLAAVPGASRLALAGRGIVRVTLPATAPVAEVVRALRALGAVVGERLPPAAWALVPAPEDRLSRGVRDAFDPCAILNPGILTAVGAP